jgi:hypothetical protein
MLKKISDLADVMKEKKILHCEYVQTGAKVDLKITLDPSSLYQDTVVSQLPDAMKDVSEYDDFLFKAKAQKEARLKTEIENM